MLGTAIDPVMLDCHEQIAVLAVGNSLPAASFTRLHAMARDLRAFAKRAGHHIVVYRETASGAKNDRVERKKVMALAQTRGIDATFITDYRAGVATPSTSCRPWLTVSSTDKT